jgi:hypothetical protein
MEGGAMILTPMVGRRHPARRLLRLAGAAWAVPGRYGIRLPSPRRTPFTFWYLMVLLGTTIVLRSVSPQTAQHLLLWSSTNITELRRHPIEVMIASALWLPGLVWAPYALMYTVVLAPVERAVGGRWTAMVFVSGHLFATLATQLPVALLIWLGELGRQWDSVLDVGVSYGVYTTGGVLVGLLVPRWRWIWLAIAEGGTLLWLALAHDLTGAGHLIALNLGLLWWRWLDRRGVFGTLRPWAPLRFAAAARAAAEGSRSAGQPLAVGSAPE